MQVVTNQEYVNGRAKIGKYGTIAGFVGMAAGFATSFNIENVAASYALLIFGLLALNVGRYHSIRWGGHPRVDEVLSNALKGLDQKYVLINYAAGVPSPHVILSPFGLIHIETRHNEGEITCDGDRWKKKRSFFSWMRGFAEGPLGNPSRSALEATDRLKSSLSQRLGPEVAQQVLVEGVVVFVSPRAELKASGSTVPSVTPKDLRATVRTPAGRSKIPSEVYRKVYEVLVNTNGKSEEITNVKAESRNNRSR